MTNHETVCPNCQHDQHLPGTECEARVHHGPRRFHACLCLARPGAALPCPPQMTCQGGTLGYSDVWYLQQGHSLSSADGVILPEVLGPVAVGFPTPDDGAPAAVSVPPPAPRADDQAALRDRIAEVLADADGWRWAEGFKEQSPTWQGYQQTADAVLPVLPEPADRADRVAVLAEVADWLKAWRPEFFERWAITEQERYEGGVDDAAAELRRLADEAQQPETETAQPAPTSPAPTALRVTVLREILGRISGGRDGDSATEEVGASTVRAVLEEILAEMQPATGPCVAGEQQNETPEAEAHPAEHSWAAELHDPLADEWVPGTRYTVRDRAVNALTHSRRLGPTWKDGSPTERRLVRATTTYTVEPDPEPAVEAPE